MSEPITSSETIAEREALFTAWKYATDQNNDPTITWGGTPPFKFSMDFTHSAPHTAMVNGQPTELPEGYVINFDAQENASGKRSWLQRSKNNPVTAPVFAKAFEGIFSRRGITPDIRTVDAGIWVSAATIDALIERGVYRIVDRSYENAQSGHIMAEALKKNDLAGFNKLLSDAHAILEHGKFDAASVELDYNRGEDGAPRPIKGHHMWMEAPLVRVADPKARNYLIDQVSPMAMIREMGSDLREMTARNASMSMRA